MSDEALNLPSGRKQNVVTLSESTVLTEKDSGKFYILDTLSANGTITLPAISAGIEFRMVVTATFGFTWTINCPDGSFIGGSIPDVVGSGITSTGSANLVVKASATPGTVIHLICGTSLWWATGAQSAAAELSFSG